MRALKQPSLLVLAFVVALSCLAACSSSNDVRVSSSAASSSVSAASEGSSSAEQTAMYETEYFVVELPPSWGNAWSVELGQEYRSAMDATNYSYAFSYDGAPQFTIECKLFSLDGDASIGSTGQRQVEFHASDNISAENEFYVREHIEVKHAAEAAEKSDETVPVLSSSSTTPAGVASSETKADPLSGPVGSETEALNRVHDCLMHAGKEMPPKIEFDHMTDAGRYVIHGYEVVNDGGGASHNATWFWYSVGKDGSMYDEVLMREIDPMTMEAAGQSALPKNDYYVVSLPPELSGAAVSYEEGRFGGPTTAGAITGVVVDDELLFEVVCLSNDWGPQGDMAVVEIGSPSVDPSSVVYLTVPVRPANGDQSDRDAAKKKALEYAAYVTLL
ncbi:MAG: hypothetical protein IJH88_06160 [Eggerthellaceae bacterium]|nr:hypothetical protein [Eggerthellaceae bacterium]